MINFSFNISFICKNVAHLSGNGAQSECREDAAGECEMDAEVQSALLQVVERHAQVSVVDAIILYRMS